MQFRPSLAFQIHMEKHRKLVKKVGRQRYKESVARMNRLKAEEKRGFITNLMKGVRSAITYIKDKITNLFRRTDNKYHRPPHDGKQAKARRRRQIAKGQLTVSNGLVFNAQVDGNKRGYA